MFTVSVYAADLRQNFVGHKEVFGVDRLTPKIAQGVLKMSGLDAGMVYQEGVRLSTGEVGTVAYRVYRGGRARRLFWPLVQTSLPDCNDRPF